MQALRLLLRSSGCRLYRLALVNQGQAALIRHLNKSQILFAQQIHADRVTVNTRNMSSSGPIYTVDYLSSKIQKELEAEHVDIEDLSNCGCGMKFDALIVSPKFEGKPILQRQRLVNQTLAEEMKHIHAFTMKTLTPNQWKESQSKNSQGNG